jgi:uncharacterized membrane protein YhaH (DUF805 family)
MFLFSPFGRIGRGQWWLGQLAIIVTVIAGSLLTALLFGQKTPDGDLSTAAYGGIAIIVVFACYINICVTITRYHDRGKSGWWYFFAFIPVVGPIWQLIECGILPGDDGDNEYGYGDGGRFDISDEIAAMAATGKTKPAFVPKSSFSPPTRNSQPSNGFGQAPKPMFGGR